MFRMVEMKREEQEETFKKFTNKLKTARGSFG